MEIICRVAMRHLAQREAMEAALAIFKSGTPPDDGVWRGGPPDIRTSFTGVQADKVTTEEGRGGVTHVTALLKADPKKYADGVYADSFLFQRFLKAFPGHKRDLLDAFMQTLNPRHVQQDIKRHYEGGKFSWHLLTSVFWRDADEWESPTKIQVRKVQFGKQPIWDRGSIKFPWSALVTFNTVRKEPVSKAPFSGMSDRELNKWISKWEQRAPENFWADGELRMNRSQAYKMYRDKWRKMTPRQQVDMMEDLKRY